MPFYTIVKLRLVMQKTKNKKTK